MGSLCACCGTAESGKDEFGTDKDMSNGPRAYEDRGCTDVVCCGVFVVHWGVFLFVMFMGFAGGDPRRLYRPRDYRGDWCGLGDYENFNKLVYAMNTTAQVEPIVQTLVCSSAATNHLETILSGSDYNTHLCNCCLTPCERCGGSLGFPDEENAAELSNSISGSMSRLTDFKSAGVASPSAVYAAIDPSALFTEMTKYFIPVCYFKTCRMPEADDPNLQARNFTYQPDYDSMYRTAWDGLLESSTTPTEIRDVIRDKFTFQALSRDVCPYEERYCVATPGVNFTEAPNDLCLPKLSDTGLSAMGAEAAKLIQGIGESAVMEGAADGMGDMVGKVMDTIDALFIVTIWSFLIGLAFMILLRFFVGCFVWSSLILVGLALLCGGGVAYIRSGQCKGASLLSSGTQAMVAVAVVAESAVNDALDGDDNNTCKEALAGNGENYTGCQSRTRSGRLCQRWDVQGAPHNHTWTPAIWPNANLKDNYCRNPANASSIWCVTTDSEKEWELCYPIGLLTPECPQGYEMSSEVSRDVLKICAYVTWCLCLIWALLVCCMWKRIRLAIAINEAAAMFITYTPTVLLVPMVQILMAVIYSLTWAVSASFLLSQVPADYTSSEYYATWTEAMGNATTPGACNPKWPAGFAWKDSGDLTVTNDPCSGNLGVLEAGDISRCWRCSPPRYVFDYYFAYSFFSYLWNNALLVALGQCIIAGAVGVWFFTKTGEKGPKSFAVKKSVAITLRYHLGSLALGSFIIAVVQFIRYVLLYFSKQAEMQKNFVMQIILKCIACCMWCLEKFLKFINKNAYIQIALLGTNFCVSAKNAFWLIFRNMARFSTMMVLGSIIHFIGTCVIIVGTAMSGYFILDLLHPEASPVVPMLVYISMSWVVAKLFMNVFGLAVDTTLQCFIIAEEAKLSQNCVPKPLKSLFKRVEAGEDAEAKSSKVVPSAS